MKLLLTILILFLISCSTPLKPQPAGTTEKTVAQGKLKYVVTNVGLKAPVCLIPYFHGVDEDENAVRSSKYPHDELIPMARKKGCSILTFSYGSVWLLNSDKAPGIPTCWFNCKPAPTIDEFVTDFKAIIAKEGLPTRLYAEGVSQGGYNLSSVAMKYPKMFEKVIVADPVMQFLNQFKLQTLLISSNFTDARWSKMNPVNAIMNAPEMTPIYLISSDTDIMVASDAAKEFYRICKARGFDCTIEISDHDHGKFDSKKSLAWIVK